MNTQQITDKSGIHLSDMAAGIRFTPFDWRLCVLWSNEHGLAVITIGPFDLFLEW